MQNISKLEHQRKTQKAHNHVSWRLIPLPTKLSKPTADKRMQGQNSQSDKDEEASEVLQIDADTTTA